MKLLLFLLCAAFITSCQQPSSPASHLQNSADSQKAAIRKAVADYWAEKRPGEQITAYAFMRYNEDLYLVGVTFKGSDDVRPTNTVVRRFENENGRFWRAEGYGDKWRSILRAEPEQ
jgi:hypothetical protein